jgi:GTP diphosphokinase / guanosine-3',5'-bis(diphosphate) 3'-diphosphatase
MNYKLIKDRALEIVTKGHAGQKRRDGKDYITHPIAVAEIAVKQFLDIHGFDESDRLVIYLAAIAHDLAEDTSIKEREYVNELLEIGLDKDLSSLLYMTLLLLNKKSYKSYLDYILAIKENIWAIEIKLADLTHNLSDLKNGSQKDKYMLAQYILENEN